MHAYQRRLSTSWRAAMAPRGRGIARARVARHLWLCGSISGLSDRRRLPAFGLLLLLRALADHPNILALLPRRSPPRGSPPRVRPRRQPTAACRMTAAPVSTLWLRGRQMGACPSRVSRPTTAHLASPPCVRGERPRCGDAANSPRRPGKPRRPLRVAAGLAAAGATPRTADGPAARDELRRAPPPLRQRRRRRRGAEGCRARRSSSSTRSVGGRGDGITPKSAASASRVGGAASKDVVAPGARRRSSSSRAARGERRAERIAAAEFSRAVGQAAVTASLRRSPRSRVHGALGVDVAPACGGGARAAARSPRSQGVEQREAPHAARSARRRRAARQALAPAPSPRASSERARRRGGCRWLSTHCSQTGRAPAGGSLKSRDYRRSYRYAKAADATPLARRRPQRRAPSTSSTRSHTPEQHALARTPMPAPQSARPRPRRAAPGGGLGAGLVPPSARLAASWSDWPRASSASAPRTRRCRAPQRASR